MTRACAAVSIGQMGDEGGVQQHWHSMGRLRYVSLQCSPVHNHAAAGAYRRPVSQDTPDHQLRRISEQITEVQLNLMAKQKCLLQVKKIIPTLLI